MDRWARGLGVPTIGLSATIPAPSAILNAPASGARANRTVLAASPLPSFLPPSFVSFRCQARMVSGVTSRTFLVPR
jgi:hypothetical protein